MRQQHDQRIADAADLFAIIGTDIRQHLLLDLGIARLTHIDIDDAQLIPDRAEKRRPRIDGLCDITGKRHLEAPCSVPPVTAATRGGSKLRLLSGLIKASLGNKKA